MEFGRYSAQRPGIQVANNLFHPGTNNGCTRKQQEKISLWENSANRTSNQSNPKEARDITSQVLLKSLDWKVGSSCRCPHVLLGDAHGRCDSELALKFFSQMCCMLRGSLSPSECVAPRKKVATRYIQVGWGTSPLFMNSCIHESKIKSHGAQGCQGKMLGQFL